MIYMWFTGIYYKLAIEKHRDCSFTAITTIWKTMQSNLYYTNQYITDFAFVQTLIQLCEHSLREIFPPAKFN